MKQLLSLLLLSACGGDYIASGNITVTHKIEISSEQFEAYCEDLYPNNKTAQVTCVNDLVSGFLDSFKGL
jgi:hypothetical protein